MRRTALGNFSTGALVALLLSAAFAASASASPAWKFNSTELTGSETIAGDAVLSSMTIPGLTTSCKKMHYEMTISNSAGTGKGELQALSFTTCFTNSKDCTVGKISAEKLPWAAHLATIGSNYVIFEGVKIAILYQGELCVLDGTLVTVTGSVAGLYDNTSETFTFSASNSKTAKTTLKALGSPIDWSGVFTTEATGIRAGQALTVS